MRAALTVLGRVALAALSLLADAVVGVLSFIRMLLPSSVVIPRDYEELQRPSREFEEKHARRYRDEGRRR